MRILNSYDVSVVHRINALFSSVIFGIVNGKRAGGHCDGINTR
jgi:hypothetical protein